MPDFTGDGLPFTIDEFSNYASSNVTVPRGHYASGSVTLAWDPTAGVSGRVLSVGFSGIPSLITVDLTTAPNPVTVPILPADIGNIIVETTNTDWSTVIVVGITSGTVVPLVITAVSIHLDFAPPQTIDPPTIILPFGGTQQFTTNQLGQFTLLDGGGFLDITGTTLFTDFTGFDTPATYRIQVTDIFDSRNFAIGTITLVDGCNSVPCAGRTITLSVSSDGPISYATSVGWLHVSGPLTGSGTITIRVDSNAGGVTRVGTVTIGGQVLAFQQDGGC